MPATREVLGPGVGKVVEGMPYINSEGQLGLQSGRVEVLNLPGTAFPQNWVQRTHPFRVVWVNDELKQRASFIGDRQHLAPFLVPHRFEGGKKGKELERAKLGYGIGLNKAYLHEIFGHVRGTPSHYTWGSLGGPKDDDVVTPPTLGVAERLWYDATGDGVSWTNFFEGRVFEWMMTSLGGFVLVDSNRPEGVALTQSLADSLGIRSSFKWIPWSWIEDFGRGPNGYRWIKFAETNDAREPRMKDLQDTGYEKRHMLYTLMPDGRTQIERYDDKANRIGPPVFQRISDTNGRGILPLIEAKFGEHPDLPNIGSGLLAGLDDIAIDLYNTLTEIREAFRDAAFGFLSYKGPDFEGAHEQLKEGTRLVNVGDDPNAGLTRVAGDSSEVMAGISVFDIGLKNWSLSAKRRAMEIMTATSARSGLSLKAEFQLDLRPLLVAVTEILDHVETTAMFVLAQIEGSSFEEANKLFVKRETEFQLEQEASRIARIVGEYMAAIPAMPAALLDQMIMRWAGSIDFLKLDDPMPGQGGKTLRQVIQAQSTLIANSEQKARLLQNAMTAITPGGGGGPDSFTKGGAANNPGTVSEGSLGGGGGTGGTDLTGA